MSLDIRYLTNGEKNVYVVVDAAVRTGNYYNSREEIPAQIRHYAPDGNPRFVGPDDARMFLAMNALYPDLVHEYCSEPRYTATHCIFESCFLENWETCKYRYTKNP